MGSNDDCCVGMGKFLAFLSFLAFLLHAVAVANPYWLEKEFHLAVSSTPGAPTVSVESHIGLVWACSDQQSAALGIDKYKCESLSDIDKDLVEDWQWITAGLAIVSVLGTFLGVILSTCIACMSGRNMGLRYTAAVSYFVASVLFVAVLIQIHEHKDVLVMVDPIEIRQDYNLNWGFYVGAAGACMFFVMSLLHLTVACGFNKMNTVV